MRICILFALVSLLSGCGVTIYRNTTTIVGNPAPIKYENELAQRYFEKAIQDVTRRVESDDFGFLVFYFYESNTVLSPEVHKNRQFRVADVDGDQFLSLTEAKSYYAKHRDDFDQSSRDRDLKALQEAYDANQTDTSPSYEGSD